MFQEKVLYNPLILFTLPSIPTCSLYIMYTQASTSVSVILKNPFESKRLVYRAIDLEKDEEFYNLHLSDPIGAQLSSSGLLTPSSKEKTRDLMKRMSKDRLLSVVICLKPREEETQQEQSKPIPIGSLTLSKNAASISHLRFTMIGLGFLKDYQDRGYGGEAILWATGWAFERAGMHRVEIGTIDFNTKAKHLYQKLGFIQEAIARKKFWSDGQFWDVYEYSMLDSEWPAIKERHSL